jgi:hypothetical protein
MGGVRRVRPRHDDEPNSGAQSSLLRSHDVAEPPPDAISHNGGTNMFWRDESGPEKFLFLYVRGPENQKTSTLRGALSFHAGELGRQRQPLCFRKGEFLPAHDPDRAPDLSGRIKIMIASTSKIRKQKASRGLTAGSLSKAKRPPTTGLGSKSSLCSCW